MSSTSNQHLQSTFVELLDTHAGSGFEQRIADKMQSYFSEYTADVRVDNMGNVVATVPPTDATEAESTGDANGKASSVLVTAHMDEISLVVTAIEPDGFLRVWDLYAFDPRTLVGQEVLVHGRETRLGIVGSKPPHLSTPEERKHATPLDDLFIDLALPADKVKALVRVGDRVTVRRHTLELLNGRIAGKALDNRASLAVQLECLRHLSKLRHTATVTAAASVQEEVTMVGAATLGYGRRPDIAIAVDVTFGDLPGQAPEDSFALGEGPVITMGPNIHPKVFRGLRDTALRHNIPFQVEYSQGPTGTEASALQIAAQGLATGLVGVAIRYMHTSVETVAYDDIVACGRLLAYYIADIDPATVEGLTCY